MGKIPNLPERNIIIKNLDKDTGWNEKWKKGQSPGLLPHPFRLVALGNVGRGKTNSCKNLFLKHQSTRRKFKKLIIITCDIDSKEWIDCEPNIITDQMIGLEEFDEGEWTWRHCDGQADYHVFLCVCIKMPTDGCSAHSRCLNNLTLLVLSRYLKNIESYVSHLHSSLPFHSPHLVIDSCPE